LVVVVVELDETETLAALVVLANNVGSLDVKTLEDLGQTSIINAEGQVGNEQSVVGGGPGSSVGLIAGGTGSAGASLPLGGSASGGIAGGSVVVLSRGRGSSGTLTIGGSTTNCTSASSTTEEAATTTATASTSAATPNGTLTRGRSIASGGSVGVALGLFLTRTGDFDVDLTVIDEFLVEELYGLPGLLLGLKLDKSIPKGTGASGNDAGGSNFSSSLEFFHKGFIIGLEGQVSNEYFGPRHDEQIGTGGKHN